MRLRTPYDQDTQQSAMDDQTAISIKRHHSTYFGVSLKDILYLSPIDPNPEALMCHAVCPPWSSYAGDGGLY